MTLQTPHAELHRPMRRRCTAILSGRRSSNAVLRHHADNANAGLETHVTWALAFMCLALLHATVNADEMAPDESSKTVIPYVNVMDFGAHPDNADNTQQIQAAINTGKKAVVPPGRYAVNGTLVIGGKEYLHLAHGAWLVRLAGRTDNTEPVVRLTGNFARLTGEGHASGVSTQNASGGNSGDAVVNNGVVNVGPVRAEQYTNINWWVIESICISGSSADWNAYNKPPYPDDVDRNELLTLVCGAPLSAGRGSCYNGRVSGCLFRYGGIAIKANPICNGNLFTNNHFYRITHSCYYSDRTTENLFTNCFVHSAPGVTVIRLENTGYNHCYGVMCEPGPTAANGRYTRYCNVSADSSQNVIVGHGNTGHSYINESKSSLIISHASLSLGLGASFGSVNARSVQTKELVTENIISPLDTSTRTQHSEVFVKRFKPSQPTAFQDVFTFTCDTDTQVFMIELSVASGLASTGNHSAAKFMISGKRGSGKAVSASVDRIGGDPAIKCRTRVDANKVTVQIEPSYYMHGQFIIMLRAKSTGQSTLTNRL
ncbi:MAG: glycoside hydrolase family 55 protein [Candidatus Pacebacteria bacterium]|nr:glycoside hydrolase family 55 protein [Candidatus Paceibacterota bacterium]